MNAIRLGKGLSTSQIHATRWWRVRSYPGTQLPSLEARLAANIRRAMQLSTGRQDALLNRLDGMVDGERVCLGDFHLLNVWGRLVGH